MLFTVVIAVVWLAACLAVLALCASAKRGDAEDGAWAAFEEGPALR